MQSQTNAQKRQMRNITALLKVLCEIVLEKQRRFGSSICGHVSVWWFSSLWRSVSWNDYAEGLGVNTMTHLLLSLLFLLLPHPALPCSSSSPTPRENRSFGWSHSQHFTCESSVSSSRVCFQLHSSLALICNLCEIPPPPLSHTPSVSHTHPLAHTDTHMPKLMKPSSPRSLITWLTFYPEPSLKRDGEGSPEMERGIEGWKRGGRREEEGAEIQPRGRGLRPHSVSAQQRHGDQPPWSLFTISIPVFLSLSISLFLSLCFF